MSKLTLVKYLLPPAWDGWQVKWEKFEAGFEVQICPPPKEPSRCDCGSQKPPMITRGWRQPKPGEMTGSTKPRMGRFGRWVQVPVMVPAWPVADLFVSRCVDCGVDQVWDMRTDEWWELGPEDYGTQGSARPGSGEGSVS